MVITCLPVYMEVTGTKVRVVSEWHLLEEEVTLCPDFDASASAAKRYPYLPQGARICTKCINELLRRLDFSRIGDLDATQAETQG